MELSDSQMTVSSKLKKR